jgi:hypothetical protein
MIPPVVASERGRAQTALFRKGHHGVVGPATRDMEDVAEASGKLRRGG